MIFNSIEVVYRFVPYGTEFDPLKNTLVLDVGMKTVPGIIDHHHPQAEPECTASLIAKYPFLVLDHIARDEIHKKADKSSDLNIITHRFPDFDAVSSIFLALKLIETGQIDPAMAKIATYTKLVDSATLPKEWDLASTPYAILRALFLKIRKDEVTASLGRVKEGLKFMNFLYSKSIEGHEIFVNKVLFSGIDRYERAIRRAEDDYFNYLNDLERGQRLLLNLPLVTGRGTKTVDGLVVRNPRSYLLKDWARRDDRNPSLKQGFSFLMTNFGNRRFILGVDPEKGIHLKGLGDILNEKEAYRRKELERPLTHRWYDGNCPFFNFRIIDSPQDETSLSHQEIIETILKFGQKKGTE
jgi:hypothetical protein